MTIFKGQKILLGLMAAFFIMLLVETSVFAQRVRAAAGNRSRGIVVEPRSQVPVAGHSASEAYYTSDVNDCWIVVKQGANELKAPVDKMGMRVQRQRGVCRIEDPLDRLGKGQLIAKIQETRLHLFKRFKNVAGMPPLSLEEKIASGQIDEYNGSAKSGNLYILNKVTLVGEMNKETVQAYAAANVTFKKRAYIGKAKGQLLVITADSAIQQSLGSSFTLIGQYDKDAPSLEGPAPIFSVEQIN